MGRYREKTSLNESTSPEILSHNGPVPDSDDSIDINAVEVGTEGLDPVVCKSMINMKIKPAMTESTSMSIARENIAANETMQADLDFRRRIHSLPTGGKRDIIKPSKMEVMNKSVSLGEVCDDVLWNKWMSGNTFKRYEDDSKSFEEEVLTGQVVQRSFSNEFMGLEDIYKLFWEDKLGESIDIRHSQGDGEIEERANSIRSKKSKNAL